jgi:hypothetical protein
MTIAQYWRSPGKIAIDTNVHNGSNQFVHMARVAWRELSKTIHSIYVPHYTI